MKNQQEIYILIEKLFDAKLEPIRVDIAGIKLAIYGNGKKGLFDRVKELEYWRYYITGGFVTVSVIVGFFINEIKGMIFKR